MNFFKPGFEITVDMFSLLLKTQVVNKIQKSYPLFFQIRIEMDFKGLGVEVKIVQRGINSKAVLLSFSEKIMYL